MNHYIYTNDIFKIKQCVKRQWITRAAFGFAWVQLSLWDKMRKCLNFKLAPARPKWCVFGDTLFGYITIMLWEPWALYLDEYCSLGLKHWNFAGWNLDWGIDNFWLSNDNYRRICSTYYVKSVILQAIHGFQKNCFFIVITSYKMVSVFVLKKKRKQALCC